jgi:hypothetical protein
MNPAPNAAPILPKTAARRSGGVKSAIYAKAVEMLADVMPEIRRPMNSQSKDGASAINT